MKNVIILTLGLYFCSSSALAAFIQGHQQCHRAGVIAHGIFDGVFKEKDDSWKDEAMAQNQAMLKHRQGALKGQKLHNVYKKQGRVRNEDGKYDLNALTGTRKGAVIAKKSDKVSFSQFSSRNRESAQGDRAGRANNKQAPEEPKKGGWNWKW